MSLAYEAAGLQLPSATHATRLLFPVISLALRRLLSSFAGFGWRRRNQAFLGQSGPEIGVRELVIGGTPYLVTYRVRGKRIIINSMARSTAASTLSGRARARNCTKASAAARRVNHR